jgi:oligopeptide transport system substrate-binding protein
MNEMRFSRPASALAALLGALLLLGACGQGGEQAGPTGRSDGAVVLHRGNAAEPETLDPDKAQGNYEVNIINDIMVGLMTWDANAKPIPGMATSWETSEDGLTWTFHLRDATWSDGMPVTADDFIFAWQRILDPKTAAKYAYFIYLFKNAEPINSGKMPPAMLGARAIDAHTIELQLEHPAPYLLEMLTHQTTYPVPKHVVEAKGDDWVRPENFVGNGPYRLTE